MKKESGFSLVEMMAVLLVTAIIAAASAPMFNKAKTGAVAKKSPWVEVNSNAYYNSKGSNASAVIGAVHAPAKLLPKLYINRKANEPHIVFGNSNTNVARLSASNTTFNFSEKTETQNAFIIGMGNSQIQNSVVIGENNEYEKPSIMLGFNNDALKRSYDPAMQYGLAIGRNSVIDDDSWKYGQGKGAVAIGTSTYTADKGDVAIGHGASSNGLASSIAIGKEAKVNNGDQASVSIGYKAQGVEKKYNGPTHSVIMGTEASANYYCSVVVGKNAEAKETRSVTIGTDAFSDCYDNVVIGRNAYAQLKKSGNESGKVVDNPAIGCEARVNRPGLLILGHDTRNFYGYGGADKFFKDKLGIIIDGTIVSFVPSDAILIGNSTGATYTTTDPLGSLFGDPIEGQMHAVGVNRNSVSIGTLTHTSSTGVCIGAGVKGEGDVAIGYKSRSFDTAIAIGRESYAKSSNLALGTSVRATAGYSSIVGNTGHATIVPGTLYANKLVCTSLVQESDSRLKTIITEFRSGLNEIVKLKPYNYSFKKDKKRTPRVGVIAQDLQKIFPDAVFQGKDGFLSIRLEDMFYTIVNAIKELDTILIVQNNSLDEMLNTNKASYKRLDDIDKRIAKLEKKELKRQKHEDR